MPKRPRAARAVAEAGRHASPLRFRLPWRSIAFGLALAAGAAQAAGRDLHLEWEDRCAECHGHAGAFARDRLAVVDGVLTSDHWGSDLGRFLANHHTSPATLEPFIAMLTEQATTPPIYALNCAGCHGAAADLVKTAVVRRDGRLFGAANQRPLDVFLQRHGGLDADELPVVLERLERLYEEVGGR
jgi:mono/diheme cytochrome c family protein